MTISDDGGTMYGASFDNGRGIYKSLAATYPPTISPSISPTVQPTDVSTSNTWVGPQSGTSGIGWLPITSDASGVNLVAGSYNSGINYVYRSYRFDGFNNFRGSIILL